VTVELGGAAAGITLCLAAELPDAPLLEAGGEYGSDGPDPLIGDMVASFFSSPDANFPETFHS
jgi:hypothetical protein